MGILNIVEEIAGAVAAEKAVESVDPNAGFLTEAAAAVGGFEGVRIVKEKIAEATEQVPPAGEAGQA